MSCRPESEDIPNPFPKGTSGDCLVRALTKRGITYRYLSPDEITHPRLAKRRVLAFEINRVLYYFDSLGCLRVSDPRGVKVPGPLINKAPTRRKDLLKFFLREHGVSVPEGAAFPYHARHKAEAFFAAFCPSLSHGVCVKPADGKWGRQVHIGIRDMHPFRAAFAAVGERYKRVLVEETVPGIVHRFTCVAGRVIAAQFSRPANVEGDGVHTIADLVAIKNAERELNPCYARFKLQLGRRERSFLSQAGFEVSHVPEAGKLVFLNNLSNLHRGGEFIDVTDEIHPSYIELVEEVLGLFPGLVLCGADMVIEERSNPATDDNHHVLELNRCPGFADHHYPWRGQHRDVAGAIVDYLATTATVSGGRGKKLPYGVSYGHP